MLVILILLLLDFYAFQAFRTVLPDGSGSKILLNVLYWVISLGIYAAAVYMMSKRFEAPAITVRWVFGIMICVFAAKVVIALFMLGEDGFRVSKWIASKFGNSATTATSNGISRSRFLSQVGLLAGGSTLGLFVWGMLKTAYNYRVRKTVVQLSQLPKSFTPLKIVQISDMHLGSFLNTDAVERAVNIINEQQPDLIFFTGDMVNEYSREAEPFIPVLSKLKAKYGVFSSMGNHDYYGEPEDIKRIMEIHGECGWNLLNNAHKVIDVEGQKIAVVGVENWGRSDYFPKLGDVQKACVGCEDADVKLLLSHDPSHWDDVVTKDFQDIDITFSGHTHGFQMGIEIPQLKIKFSPSQFVYKQWAGLYNRGKQYLYVNRGLGFIGFHGRVGIPPEITVMQVEGKA